jgi:cytoskeletal protein RodZ
MSHKVTTFDEDVEPIEADHHDHSQHSHLSRKRNKARSSARIHLVYLIIIAALVLTLVVVASRQGDEPKEPEPEGAVRQQEETKDSTGGSTVNIVPK